LSYCECDCSFAGARRPSEEEGSSRHLLGLDEINDNSSGFPGHCLTDHPLGDLIGIAVLLESKALDVGVGGDSLRFGGRSHFLDLNEDSVTFNCVAMLLYELV